MNLKVTSLFHGLKVHQISFLRRLSFISFIHFFFKRTSYIRSTSSKIFIMIITLNNPKIELTLYKFPANSGWWRNCEGRKSRGLQRRTLRKSGGGVLSETYLCLSPDLPLGFLYVYKYMRDGLKFPKVEINLRRLDFSECISEIYGFHDFVKSKLKIGNYKLQHGYSISW